MWNKIRPFFEFCGAVQFLWGLYGVIFGQSGEIYKDIQSNFNITYEFVYSGMLAIGTITIIYLFVSLVPKIYRWLKSFKIEPDTDINSALHYIVKDSIFGKGLNYNQGGFKDASNALKEYIINKKMDVFGIPENRSVQEKIKMMPDYELNIIFLDKRDTEVFSYIAKKDRL
jgi:hypothetical protein